MTSILKYLIILGISANVTILAAQKSTRPHGAAAATAAKKRTRPDLSRVPGVVIAHSPASTGN